MSASDLSMPGGPPWLAFDLAEDHPNWAQLRALLQEWGEFEGFVVTEFSNEEIDAAQWLVLGAWQNGYPQPREDEFGYREATYDLTHRCKECGIGAKQNAPFQLKREPKWGRRGLFRRFWVDDEFFARPELWRSVFEPRGIGSRPVLNTKLVELETVVQLIVEEEVDVDTEGLEFETCDTCGRVQFASPIRGLFDRRAQTTCNAVRVGRTLVQTARDAIVAAPWLTPGAPACSRGGSPAWR